MGSTVSHENIVSKSEGDRLRRNRFPTHPAYLMRSSSAYSPREFYPPPILHTLCPDFDNQITINKAKEITKLIASRNNGPKKVLHNEGGRQESNGMELTLRLSTASSSSSGCESVCGDDTDTTVASRQCPQAYGDSDTSKEVAARGRFTCEPARLSVDSGTEMDDEAGQCSTGALASSRNLMPKQKGEWKITAIENDVNAAETIAGLSSQTTVEGSKKAKQKRHYFKKSLKRFHPRTFSAPLPYVSSSNDGEKPATPVFGTSYLNREWEIVTVQEMCRRLSLDRLDQMVMPIPDGATSSQILDQSMIRQIMEILPVRAEGYPWVNIYSSEKHGFSLSTFYRKMMEWDEEMSPILLIIRDCEENVFGAIASTRLLPSEHFFGTGDSCLLFKFVTDPDTNEKELHSFAWTGDNQYFVKASKDSLSMGAGGGHYGLWLDADLNHGRSLRCQTFDNEPLAGDREDFNIQFLEAFGFRML
uniref:Oxidation resistance protein 1 n=1 Tax=Parascaris univalens TaxID=6257 RepID=A0A915APS6_PARUN